MNGRAYDYNLGRFLSVDPFIQAPSSTQSINPYSYIMNNPLAGTDPTGYRAQLRDDFIGDVAGLSGGVFQTTSLSAGSNNGSSPTKNNASSSTNPSTSADIGSQAGIAGDNGGPTGSHNLGIETVNGKRFSVTATFGSSGGAGSIGGIALGGGATAMAGRQIVAGGSGNLVSGLKFIGGMGLRLLSNVAGIVIPTNTTHLADGIPAGELSAAMHAENRDTQQKEMGRQLGLAINAAHARNENFITIFRTASPVESADIRNSTVFRYGPSSFPKQFTLNYADAAAFQQVLPVLEGSYAPYSIFSARISTRVAAKLYPNTDSVNNRTFLYLTASSPSQLNQVNTSAKSYGGIQELR